LTKRQAALLAFVKAYVAEHGGVSPTFREMAAHLKTSTSAIHWLIVALQGQGKVSYLKRKSRTIEVVA
jgi:SOS-response transcriptional repressor LexA